MQAIIPLKTLKHRR